MSDIKTSVGIYTLGCKVNQYESEAIAEKLENNGLSVYHDRDDCGIYIVNTCTVTAESDRKCRQLIRRIVSSNPDARVIVTGCLAQTAPRELSKIDGVDFVCGNTSKLAAADAAIKFANERSSKSRGNCGFLVDDIFSAPFESMSIKKFDRTRAYVKIEDGCENRCSYCIIPAARGKVRSKAPEDVVSEVKDLIDGGCREIVLTGIETASYGKDLEKCDLAALLQMVDGLGCDRIRLGSLDPSLIKDSFVSRIAGLKSLTPHFHLSLQSGSDRVLAMMRRKYNSKMAMDAIERLRAALPSVMFTTDVIVGFPGETEEDFADTVDFMKRARFLSAHIFPYSKRAGTVAAEMEGQLSNEIKKRRSAELIAIQNDIKEELLTAESLAKSEHDVLFETFSSGFAVGHTSSFIEVAVKSPAALHSEIRRVRVTSVDKSGKNLRLIGEIIEPER